MLENLKSGLRSSLLLASPCEEFAAYALAGTIAAGRHFERKGKGAFCVYVGERRVGVPIEVGACRCSFFGLIARSAGVRLRIVVPASDHVVQFLPCLACYCVG